MEFKHTVTRINGKQGRWYAYGPFVNTPGNGATYYLVQCGYEFHQEHEFMVVDGCAWDPDNVWVRHNDPCVHYAFAMAVVNAIDQRQELVNALSVYVDAMESFAEAVRLDQAYPWPAQELALETVRSAIAKVKGETE